MSIVHLSKKAEYRQPFGAVPVGTKVWLRAELQVANPAACRLLLRYEAGTLKEYFEFAAPYGEVTLLDLERPGVYFYRFTCEGETEALEHQLTVYERDLVVPEWFKHTVIYQIFPDRFCEGVGAVSQKPNSFLYGTKEDLPMYIKNEAGKILRWDFFGGNLWGVREKLSYIRQLGAGTIYFNPIFEAVSNHRYDTANYKKVDGMLGGDEAFDAVMTDCKACDLHVILDGVFSHTGEESIYFDRSGTYTKDLPENERGAWQTPDSKYRNWYSFKEDGTYDCWWGCEALPNVHEMEPSYLAYTVTGDDSVIRYWMNRGVSGWRLDVADELPDGFIGELRRVAESVNQDAVVFGEVWEDASNKISYGSRRLYFSKRELHSNTNYVFRNILLTFLEGSLSGYQASDAFMDLYENYPKENFYAQVNMTGSHDVKRLYTCMKEIAKGQDGYARDLVQAYALVQFTFPGVPLVYYGDETCMEGGGDPDNRRYYPWNHQDQDMIHWFAQLGKLRKETPAFLDGDWEPIYLDENIFAFKRGDGLSEYITLVDRFGRGVEYLCTELEKYLKKSYTIKHVAGGYGMLVKVDG